MAQKNAQVPGFPDPVGGRSKLQIIDHTGPAVYATGGEVFPQQSVLGGPNSIGLSGVLYCSGGFSESGNFYVVPVFGGGGKVGGTIKLKWFSAFGTEVTNGSTTVAAEVIRLFVVGG